MKLKSVKKIGFDFDGVFIDHKKNRKLIARKLGYRNVSEKTSVSDLKKILSKTDYKKVQKYLYGEATLKAEEMGGAAKIYKKLSKKFELFIISRRQPGHRRYARLWIRKHLDFPQNRVFFVNGDNEKRNMAMKMKVDLYIDDKLSVLKILPKNLERVLFDEYSLYKNNPDGVRVVHNFKEFVGLLAI